MEFPVLYTRSEWILGVLASHISMDKINNPHDKYFRASMSDLRIAKSFLQAHLSSKLQKVIDWNSLQLEPDQHVNHLLTQTITDMLYSVKIGTHHGFISILVEHQSTVDRLMPFRILNYCLNVMQRYLKSYPGMNLPLVIPIVFYSGQAPYHASTDIFTLFGEHESLARETFLHPFHLIDLCRIPDDEIRQHTWASIMELVQKHIWAKNFLNVFQAIAPLLKVYAEQHGSTYISGTLRYICNTAELDDPTAFAKIVDNTFSSTTGETTMTLAQIWHNEGLQKGLEEGQLATKREIAEHLMKKGFNPEFIADTTGLTLEEIGALA